MKSILMITSLLMIALAFGQENQPSQPKPQRQSAEQSQSSGNSQGEGINNLSDILADGFDFLMANRVGVPLDRTKQALRDNEGLCKLHHEALRKVTIPILYGLRPGPLYSREIEQRFFPNAVTDIDAGCIVMPVKEATVLQCHQCLEAKSRWLKSPP
jgi:hypothetical protein